MPPGRRVTLDLVTNAQNLTNILWFPDEPTLFCTDCVNNEFRPSVNDSIYIFRAAVTDDMGCIDTAVVSILVNTIFNRPAPIVGISGSVFMENGNSVDGAMMHLVGSDVPPLAINAEGDYLFEDVPINQDYVLQPEKQSLSYEGISIADIILINKHILGTELLDSPYKMIAADIDQNNVITMYDLVQLRNALLEEQESFPENTTWRFIDASYEFLNPSNPFQEDFPETYAIEPLLDTMGQLDFIAVKIGDVDNSVLSNELTQSQSRSFGEALNFTIQPFIDTNEKTITYQFFPHDFERIEGYQFSVDFDVHQMAFKQLIATSIIGEQHFGWKFLDRGTITTSWHTIESVQLSAKEPLFSLVFEMSADGREVLPLNLSSSRLPAEAYTVQGDHLIVQGKMQENPLPKSFSDLGLLQNNPNPFKESTIIGFNVPMETTLTLSVFDNTGSILFQEEKWFPKGSHNWTLKGKDLSHSGVLYYQLKSNNSVLTKKMIYAK